MATAERISAEEARRAVSAGRALLVCTYEDDAKCRPVTLDRATSFSHLRPRAGAA